MTTFNHFNFNVLDLQRSVAFYQEALGLSVVREVKRDDFTLAFLGDGATPFRLELTWMKNRTTPYDLGECEFHLAFHTDEYDALFEKHKAMGCVVYENPSMGIYFIEDPDGYWLEIIPRR